MRKRFISLFLIIVGLVVVVFSIWRSLPPKVVPDPNLPERLGGLPLINPVFGIEAVSEINQLHGQEIKISSGARGIYGDRNQIILWVSGLPTNWHAAQLVSSMQEKIANAASPFTPIGEEEVAGRTIFVLEGMGQQHYYFRSDNLVIWLAVNIDLADQVLIETLEFYP